jgi:pyridoxamine 5'-phosphate oxidase
MSDLADLRKTYRRGALDASSCAAEPMTQLRRWLDEALAAHLPEPNAMTLATVGADARPSSRVVLIKDLDLRGPVWFTNYDSRKGRQLAGNPFASLQFHWVELERVVRIEGAVEKVSAEQSDAYFASRPLDSRIGAWASPQSQPIDGRSSLLANAARYGLQFGLNPPRPPHWGGYRLLPDRVEFWQGRPSRLHDRILYLRDSVGAWQKSRLAP